MAGIVRQPIDIQSLERYIKQNVPEIKTPIDLKQVRPNSASTFCYIYVIDIFNNGEKLIGDSSDLDNQILHTNSLLAMAPSSC